MPAVLFRVRGFQPCLETHVNPRVIRLSQEEGERSYQRIAGLVRLQPEIRAMVGYSWLRSPDTHRISPHLRWINQIIVENGGVETAIGPAGASSGVFAHSSKRKALFERGAFQPTIGMAIWPRAAMLAWADKRA